MVKRISVFTILIITRVLDLITTYRVEGKALTGESSPVVSWFDLGWKSMILYNIIILVLISLIIFFNNDKRLVSIESKLAGKYNSFQEYLALIFFGKKVTFMEVLKSTYFNLRVYMYTLLNSIPLLLIIIGLFAIVNNLMAINNTSILVSIDVRYIIHIVVLFSFIIVVIIQLILMYNRYKRMRHD